jgi:hypothetical protein
MRTVGVWIAVNISLPEPQVFSKPPPAPPWSKAEKATCFAPSLSITRLITPAYTASAKSQSVSIQSLPA